MGMWFSLYDEEWDGDVLLGLTRVPSSHRDADEGTVTFNANSLPWLVGRYEVKFPYIIVHHDFMFSGLIPP
jgi:phosphatidylethanolamine N-methyltransferase